MHAIPHELSAKCRNFQMQSTDIVSICRGLWLIWFLLPICATGQDAHTGEGETGKSDTAGTSGVPLKRDYWAIEDAMERKKLPLYMTIPAARPDELTPAN